MRALPMVLFGKTSGTITWRASSRPYRGMALFHVGLLYSLGEIHPDKLRDLIARFLSRKSNQKDRTEQKQSNLVSGQTNNAQLMHSVKEANMHASAME
jgi:hypothetical protein